MKTGLCFERELKGVNGELAEVNGQYSKGDGHTSVNSQSNAITPVNSQSEAITTRLIDRYSGRVIFPWLNVSGKVVAFGGRLLDSRTKGVQQKYVNSPDSEIYHKERELYGRYQAKKAIAK